MAYKPGQWLAICDRCGMEFLSGQMKLMWNGLRVDARCWEPRHPQEFVRAIPDEQGVPWVSPEVEGPQGGPDYITVYIADDYIDADYFEEL